MGNNQPTRRSIVLRSYKPTKRHISCDKRVLRLFTDGGVIGPNPSLLGGTWAWCLVNGQDRRIACNSGIILPTDINREKVTNNVTELYAALQGLQACQEANILCLQTAAGEQVRLHWFTDSYITLLRLTTGKKFNGIPPALQKLSLYLRSQFRYNSYLLGGHPTKKELLAGLNRKGAPVSRHNVWCDQRCTKLAKRYKRKIASLPGGIYPGM